MLIGKRLYGRYKILRMIGGGGMANVYLAEDMILEREVAVKVLRMDFSMDDEFIKRFNREAQSATSLAHPNIVNVYDVGEEENVYFIVMEYVEGLTLKQYIQQQPIPVEKTIHIMQQITSAIAHAHQHGIIHRDIKPQNILIDEHDTVKITDFGIATALSATSITQTNSVLGSVHYLSPEQARGGMANKKSDIYSLGIVMFEMLTGRLPFSGESAVSIALKHLQTVTPSLRRWNPDIPQSVENIVLKATAKDPFHRYDSVEELREDLLSALSPQRVNEKPFVVPEDMDATIAMPIITEDTVIPDSDDTIVAAQDTHEYNEEDSEPFADQSKNKKKKKSKKKTKTGTNKKKEKKSKNKGFKIVLVILLLLGTLAVLSVTVFPKWFQPADVEVPEMEGKALDDAIAMLLDQGFTIGKTIKISHEEISEDLVVKTGPDAGKTVKEGTTVDIYVSTGKKRIEVDDYTGRQLEDLRDELEEKGYKDVEVTEVYDDDAVAGEIIRQEPGADALVIPSETVLEFVVSKGVEEITLKNLVEYNERLLNEYSAETGLNIEIVKEAYSDEIAEGLVISQYPDASTKVKKGSTVQVTLSKGKKELPPKIVIREVTIPYEGVNGEEQTVQIYIDDLNNNTTEPAETITITETRKVKVELTIGPDSKAAYRIISNNSVLAEEVIEYPK